MSDKAAITCIYSYSHRFRGNTVCLKHYIVCSLKLRRRLFEKLRKSTRKSPSDQGSRVKITIFWEQECVDRVGSLVGLFLYWQSLKRRLNCGGTRNKQTNTSWQTPTHARTHTGHHRQPILDYIILFVSQTNGDIFLWTFSYKNNLLKLSFKGGMRLIV